MSAAPERRLLPFAALAALAAANWAGLMIDPPLGRALLAALAASAGAAALLAIGRNGRATRRAAGVLGIAAVLAAAALGLLAVGLPARQLWPSGWDEFGRDLGRGIGALDRDFPYDGEDRLARLVLLLGLPLTLALAAALAFWPSRRARSAKGPTRALLLLLAAYGVVAAMRDPGQPLLWGLALALVVCAWLWLPALTRRRAPPAAAMVALAAAVALPLAARLDGDKPLIDYTRWRVPGAVDTVKPRWDHTYGPLDWSREGIIVLKATSDVPLHWRAAVLDRFDGFRWRRSADASRLRPPEPLSGAPGERLNPAWIERVELEVGALKSSFVPAAGTVSAVDDLSTGAGLTADGTLQSNGSLERGERYSIVTYAPQPSAAELRRAPGDYPRALDQYTTLALPRRSPIAEAVSGSAAVEAAEVTVAPRGQATVRAAVRRLEESVYAEVHRLAVRLTRGERTVYGAVHAIESHLRGGYRYDEDPPRREVPLRAFLLRDRRGYCQQFSGAMALMLRTIGIPSRVVAGFSPGGREGPDSYVVRDLDAHSWVEVYFVGIGWVTFDPTPGTSPARSQFADLFPAGVPGAGSDGDARIERPVPAEGGLSSEASSSGLLWALALTGVVALACSAALLRRRRRFRALAPLAAADAQVRELRAALPRLGVIVPPGATLLDLEGDVRAWIHPRTAAYLARLRASRFEPGALRPPTLADRRALRRELTTPGGLGWRLRGLRAIPPGAPRA